MSEGPLQSTSRTETGDAVAASPSPVDPVDGGTVVSLSPDRVISTVAPARSEPTDAARDEAAEPGLPPESPSAEADLTALLVEARLMAQRLALRLAEAHRRDRTPCESTKALDERLVLGARMLKAFEVQIERAEASIAQMNERESGMQRLPELVEVQARRRLEALSGAVDASMQQRRDEAEATIVGAAERAIEAIAEREQGLPDVEETTRRIADTAREAMARIDEHIARHAEAMRGVDRLEERLDAHRRQTIDRLEEAGAARDGQLDRLDERLAALDRRVAELSQVVESAEVSSCATAGRTTQLTEAIDERSAAMAHLSDQCTQVCEQVEQQLERSLADASSDAEALRERSAVSEATMDAKLLASEATGARLAAASERAELAAGRLEAQPEITARLERLLEKLAPWERLLLDSERTADGTPRPVASMVECLRTEIGQNMADLSTTMHSLARRVDELIPPPARSEPEAPAAPDVVTPPGTRLRFKDHAGRA